MREGTKQLNGLSEKKMIVIATSIFLVLGFLQVITGLDYRIIVLACPVIVVSLFVLDALLEKKKLGATKN